MAKHISLRLQGDLADLDRFVIWLAENGLAVEFERDRRARRPRAGDTLRYLKLDMKRIGVPHEKTP